jgi:hypothetical protein
MGREGVMDEDTKEVILYLISVVFSSSVCVCLTV